MLFVYENLFSQNYTVYNSCPNKTVNLTTHIQDPVSYGTIISWHTALPVSNTNKVQNPYSVGIGTYYAIYLDTINYCYSGNGMAATAIKVNIRSCPNDTINIYNRCQSNTVNLTTHTNVVLPSGTILSWHTALPASSSNKVSNPVAVNSGIYYAIFLDTINNCYAGNGYAATPVKVKINPNPSKPVIPLQINNICPEKTVSLSNISNKLPPSVSGSSFEWHSSNSPTSSLIENPNAVNSGTYYLFEKSSSNCYSEGAPIQVLIQDCCPTTNCPPLIVKRLKYNRPNG